jgi:hypothetical protein
MDMRGVSLEGFRNGEAERRDDGDERAVGLVRSRMRRSRFAPNYSGLSFARSLCFGRYWSLWTIQQINKVVVKVCGLTRQTTNSP